MLHDALGRAFSFDEPPRRVVSLVPSLTETLFDLGAGGSVVGVTSFCIFPRDLTAVRVGGTKNPDIDAIRALEPDLVHMNLEENLERHARDIEPFTRVFVTEPRTVADVEALIADLGMIHGRTARAADLIRQLRNERSLLPQEGFTFACPIWKKPFMWCGGDTYVSNLVAAAGGVNVLADRSRYPSIDLEGVASLAPDVVFLPDEPYAFSDEDAAAIARATKARVIGPFPGHLFTWHGTRTVAGLRFLRKALKQDCSADQARAATPRRRY